MKQEIDFKKLEEALAKLKQLSETKDDDGGSLLDDVADYVDSTTDFIREHNVGGSVGRSMADSIDRATNRSERKPDEIRERP